MPHYPRGDSWLKCQIAYRTSKNKLGPALGLAFLRSGLSSDVLCETVGQSSKTFYDWIFGRVVPQRARWRRIYRITRLLERALANGALPRADAIGNLEVERQIVTALFAEHGSAIIEATPKTL